VLLFARVSRKRGSGLQVLPKLWRDLELPLKPRHHLSVALYSVLQDIELISCRPGYQLGFGKQPIGMSPKGCCVLFGHRTLLLLDAKHITPIGASGSCVVNGEREPGKDPASLSGTVPIRFETSSFLISFP
jgi:hypothetical protein